MLNAAFSQHKGNRLTSKRAGIMGPNPPKTQSPSLRVADVQHGWHSQHSAITTHHIGEFRGSFPKKLLASSHPVPHHSADGLVDEIVTPVQSRKVPNGFRNKGRLVPRRVGYVSVADVAVPSAGTWASKFRSEEMKKLLSLLAAGILAMSAAVTTAQPLSPTPDAMSAPVHVGGPVELFHCVKYVDTKEMAPCAKPMIVEVRDPCWKPDPCNPCCKPRCVAVQICVPETCCPPVIKCSHDGKKVRYDFGQYAVDIRTKKDYIEVDYQD